MRSAVASSGAEVRERLFKVKTAALLHDPPHKPWLENHEEVASRWIQQLTGEEGIPKEVRSADRLASSVDRYLLSLLMGERYLRGFLRCQRVVLKNTVNPLFEKEVEPVGEQEAEDFFKQLCGILQGLDAKWKYFALYALYELLWIDRNLPVGPADTRVPTHTTFDHDYATATAVNWVACGKVDGYLLGIDLVDVQEVVAASRKLRDLWVSSYLVSLFTWYAVLNFVEEWGPDVVVIPSLRMNPFFLHWLLARLEGQVGEKLADLLKRYVYLSEELRLQYETIEMPPYAAFPEKAVLALPAGSVKDRDGIEELIRKRVDNAWEMLWKGARKLAEVRASSNLTWKFISGAFGYYEKKFRISESGNFDNVAPFALRVHLEPINSSKEWWRIYDEAYRSLARALREAKRVRVDPQATLKLYELTEQAFEKGLGYPRPSSRGFDYCTSCGTLPALVVLPAGERDGIDEFSFFIYKVVVKNVSPEEASEAWKKMSPEEIQMFQSWLGENAHELEYLKTIFTPGERLCPWCFLKRVLSLEPRLLRTILEGKVEDMEAYAKKLAEQASTFRLPSTSDVAVHKLREELVNAAKSGQIKDEDLNALIEVLRKVVAAKDFSIAAQKVSPLWCAQRTLDKEAEKLPHDRIEVSVLLRLLIRWDPEQLWFRADPDVRSSWYSVLRRLGLNEWLWSYYALVLADGDNIGDLLDGRVSAFFGVRWDSIKESKVKGVGKAEVLRLKNSLLRSSAVGEFGKLLDKAIEVLSPGGDREKWVEEWAKYISNNYKIAKDVMKNRLEKFLTILEEIINDEDKMPLSFSYHAALSAALTRAGILDAATIAELEGFVVYAGGDDLMSLVPVHRVAKVLIETRAHFAGTCRGKHSWEAKIEDGFVVLKRAVLPALPGVGRSYAVNTVHYIYPLQLALSDARQALDEAKSATHTCRWDEPGGPLYLHKDVAVIMYSPRARGDRTLVPCSLARISFEGKNYLRLVAKPLECIVKLLERLRPLQLTPVFSDSLLYDAEVLNELLVGVTESELAREFPRRLVERIMKRNINAPFSSNAQAIIDEVLDRQGKPQDHIDPISTSVVYVRKDGKEIKTSLFVSIARAARFLKGGMRTWW